MKLSKQAGLGGEQDVPFEQAFSNLAHSYLQDKAPGLLDYEVGFQLLDRNQENTKAVGVFGFKVGKQWLYAPVFFLNGDLKGHELLYLKSEDTFVPLKENWINMIINKKPSILGEGVDKNLGRLGVMPPNLYQMSRSPNKFASVNELNKYPAWVRDFIADIGHFITSNPLRDTKYEKVSSFVEALSEVETPVLKSFLEGFNEYPALANFTIKCFGKEAIDQAVDKVVSNNTYEDSVLSSKEAWGSKCRMKSYRNKKKRTKHALEDIGSRREEIEKVAAKVKITVGNGDGVTGLSPKEHQTLVSERLSIRDGRDDDETSTVYTTQTKISLFNPDSTGLYDVLVKPGKFERCFIIFNPYSQKGSGNNSVAVIRVEGKKAWLNVHPSAVFARTKIIDKQWDKWFDEQKDLKSLSKGGPYVAFNKDGAGTFPFDVEREVSNEIGIKTYDVHYYSHSAISRPGYLPPIDKTHYGDHDLSNDYGYNAACQITLTNKPGEAITARGGTLYIPKDFKIIKLVEDDKDDDEANEFSQNSFDYTESGESSDDPAISLGNLVDAQMLLFSKLASLTVRHSGTEIRINDAQLYDNNSAIVHLVARHGLREKVARIVLDESKKNKIGEYLIKYSEPYNLLNQGPSAPPFPDPHQGYDPMTGNNVPTQYNTEHNLKIPDMSASLTDRSIYHPMGPEPQYNPPPPDPSAQQAAMQAAQTGQKEIFDTAMLGSLLKSTRDDTMVDKYLGDLVKGLDRLGRILFTFYWHQDQFEERYGKGDMPELEDGLRNAFESVGDIVLFLKQRAISSDPSLSGQIDLEAVANS